MANRALRFAFSIVLLAAVSAPLPALAQNPDRELPAQGQNPNGMHIYIWGGLKSHGEGQHDYPQFLADWSKLLTTHGAVVDGALHAPSAADLEHTDVVVIYKGRIVADDLVSRLRDLMQVPSLEEIFSQLVQQADMESKASEIVRLIARA